MKITCALLLPILLFYNLSAQHVDIEGDARIEGKLNIISSVGDSSIFMGANAGMNDDGTNSNTFIGTNAGRSNSNGSMNTFMGNHAGRANIGGDENTFIGAGAGKTNSNASSGTFVGANAGSANTQGYYNTFLGGYAGENNTSGSANTFIGEYAGKNNISGGGNTFLGQESGTQNTTGNGNTLIGNGAGLNSSNLQRTIAIGYRARVDCNNCAVLGSMNDPVNLGLGTSNPSNHKLHVTSDDFTGAFIKGSDVAIELGGANSSFGSGSDDAVIRTQIDQPDGDLFLVSNDFITLHLNDDNNPDDSKFEIRNGANNTVATIDEAGNMVIAGNLTENSDRNLKFQISALSGVLPGLLSLAGYSYLLKDRPEQGQQIGLIAQEVEAQFPDLVHTNAEGIKSVNYTRFVPLLIEGLKAQAEMIEGMQRKYEAEFKALQQKIDALSN